MLLLQPNKKKKEKHKHSHDVKYTRYINVSIKCNEHYQNYGAKFHKKFTASFVNYQKYNVYFVHFFYFYKKYCSKYKYFHSAQNTVLSKVYGVV